MNKKGTLPPTAARSSPQPTSAFADPSGRRHLLGLGRGHLQVAADDKRGGPCARVRWRLITFIPLHVAWSAEGRRVRRFHRGTIRGGRGYEHLRRRLSE